MIISSNQQHENDYTTLFVDHYTSIDHDSSQHHWCYYPTRIGRRREDYVTIRCVGLSETSLRMTVMVILLENASSYHFINGRLMELATKRAS